MTAVMRALLAALTLLTVCALMIDVNSDRLRHLALPTFSDDAAPPPRDPHPVTEQIGTETVQLAELGKRISGIALGEDGRLWIGLFDGGVAVLTPGETRAQEVPGLTGRERFVSAIATHQGRIFAATYSGVLELNARGERVAMHLEGIAADGLASSKAGLIAGTGRGAFVLRDDGFEPIPTAEDSLRILSVSASPDALWFGTPRGVFRTAGAKSDWFPLVFGSPGAETNVATAIVAFDQGAVVGTDDGGLAWVSSSGEVRAARFAYARANEINPGASARLGRCALFGTQGAGLLVATSGDSAAVARAGPLAQISAVSVIGDQVFAGTHDGTLLSLRFPAAACAEPRAAR